MAGHSGGHSSHPIHMHPVRHPVLESMLLTPQNVSNFFTLADNNCATRFGLYIDTPRPY